MGLSLLVAALAFAQPSRLIATAPLALVHLQRYAMGTMFDIVVYHPSPSEARRAIELAMAEILRLDRVMSHYRADSDLAKLAEAGRAGYVTVDPSLYDVIAQSLTVSRLSGGRFDVTIAPLLKVWKRAHEEARRPTADEIARAARCVGYEKIEVLAPDRIRLRSDCIELDLGGIGKGYAVDRAIAILTSAGIAHALVNAGGSTIAARGAPPGQRGWPADLGTADGRRIFLVDESLSTSQPNGIDGRTGRQFGEILDPARRAPAQSSLTVNVLGRSATTTDALSTTLLLLTTDEGKRVLGSFPDTAAVWVSPSGHQETAHGRRLDLESAGSQ